MSSRALRKAQRQREELARLREDDIDGSDEEQTPTIIATKSPAFAVLGEDDPEEEDEQEEDGEVDPENQKVELYSNTASSTRRIRDAFTPKKKKKKPKRGSIGSKGQTPEAAVAKNPPSVANRKRDGMDEIDKAVEALSMKKAPALNPEVMPSSLGEALSIDNQSLNPANEMRRLFGRAASAAEQNEADAVGDARRRRGQQQAGLARAVAGHNGPGARGLAGLSLRRNVFIPGKEEWPRGPGGGLSMELANISENGLKMYRFVRNSAYQDVQRQFEECVLSMDPQRLIQLLQFNPYHISTLLQVSEIAKHEGDHSTSGDLLERALFSLGRAVHSTFPNSLSQGKALLDFKNAENRELWLAGYRYVRNLGMRGTWRTAYEWAKLLLSISPVEDPYKICLVIDQLALRARQPKHFLDISNSNLGQNQWQKLPNIRISQALAYYQLNQASNCREVLESSIKAYPYIFARLFQELEISRIPPSIWGAQPSTSWEKLMCELYVSRAADLWKTPEAISMLCGIAEHVQASTARKIIDSEIDIDTTRHVYLTEERSLIALLPQKFISRPISSSDPLPPRDAAQESIDDNQGPRIQPTTVFHASADGGIADDTDLSNYLEEMSTNQNFISAFLAASDRLLQRRGRHSDGSREPEEGLRDILIEAGLWGPGGPIRPARAQGPVDRGEDSASQGPIQSLREPSPEEIDEDDAAYEVELERNFDAFTEANGTVEAAWAENLDRRPLDRFVTYLIARPRLSMRKRLLSRIGENIGQDKRAVLERGVEAEYKKWER